MTYNLGIFNNPTHCSWLTIYVGYQLNFLSHSEISYYARDYLLKNADCTNQYIAQLAYEADKDNTERCLVKILTYLKYPPIEKDDKLWNLEKRKWRFYILKSITSANDVEKLINEIESVYCDFEHPNDMNSLIHYRPEAGFRTVIGNSIIVETPHDFLNRFSTFLENEKKDLESML